MRWRDFLGLTVSAGMMGVAGAAAAQERKGAQPAVEPRKPNAVVKLFKSPEGFPNGLENTPEGLWIAEEVSERAYLVDGT